MLRDHPAGSKSVIQLAIVISAAAIGIAALYAAGFSNIGGVLLLSGIFVAATAFVKSGAISASWLQRQDSKSAVRCALLELAKGLITASIGIDFVVGFTLGVQHRVIPDSVVTAAILVTVALLSSIGAGIFGLRFFGALLLGGRR